MTKKRLNAEKPTHLVAALVSNAGALHKGMSRLLGDVDKLHRRIKNTHRAADRLHHKIDGTRARIRIFRSQDRVRRRKITSRAAQSA